MRKTAVQSDASKNKVAKLSYQVCGPFRIVKCTGQGSYLVRKLFKTDSLEFEFMATYLYSLLPSLNPCKLVSSVDTKYLNQFYFPVTNSLIRFLNIGCYNETWFDEPLRICEPLFNNKYQALDFPEPFFTLLLLYPIYILEKKVPSSLLIKTFDTNICSSSSPTILSKALSIWNGLFLLNIPLEIIFSRDCF